MGHPAFLPHLLSHRKLHDVQLADQHPAALEDLSQQYARKGGRLGPPAAGWSGDDTRLDSALAGARWRHRGSVR